MTLSIIIINFNTYQITVDCIKSIILNTEDISYEIILVDNFPKEDFKSRFLELSPYLQYIRCDENIGFGRANNLGMSKAGGDYILLLNSDTIIVNDALLKCINYLNSSDGQSFGVLGCRLLNADRTYQASFYPFTKHDFWNYCISNNPALSKIFKIKNAFSPPEDVREVGDVSGAFMMLRKEVFKNTGGFDPDFFLYYEETEWCRNRIHKNYKIVYYPKAMVIHLGGQSSPKTAIQLQSCVSQALYWYKKGWPSYISYILFNIFNSIFYIFQYPFTNPDVKQSIKTTLKTTFASFSYWLYYIPKYSRKFGARPEPLIYEGARQFYV